MTLVLVGLAWVAGLVAVGVFAAPWWMGAAWVAAALPMFLVSKALSGRYGLAAVCVVAALLAGYRLHGVVDAAVPGWAGAIGTEVELTGTVDSEPDRGTTTTGYVLRVETVTAGGSALASGGKVLVYLHQYADYLPGDRLTVAGKLEMAPVFDGFDYRAYLARRGISATMLRPKVLTYDAGQSSAKRWLTEGRLDLDLALQRSLPEPEASLAAGIAYGRDDGLSREAKDDYNRAGLRHLVAVSGSNVVLVVALTYVVAIPLIGRRWAWLPAAVTLATYLAAAGLSPSVLRSGLMAAVLLGGTVIGRPQSGLPALAAAVVGMTAVSPGLAFDAGFQLSATATAGLVTVSPWLTQWIVAGTARARLFLPIWLCQTIALTLSASLSTAPVMWVTFGQISLISPLANAVVEPVFALAFWASIVTSTLGLVSRPLGEASGAVAYYPLAFIKECSRLFGEPSWAAVETPETGRTWVVASYTVLGAIGFFAYRYAPRRGEEPVAVRSRRIRFSRLAFAGAAGATALAIVPVSLFPRSGPGELVVQFLDVGQGDAALITTPHGSQILIDGGPSGIDLARELGEVMPHWDRSLDLVIVSHPQEDHIAGIPEVFSRLHVGEVDDNGAENATASYAIYEDERPARLTLSQGDSFERDGVGFEVLWPPADYAPKNLNNTSIIVRVTYEGVSFLFTGDAEGPAFEALSATESVRASVLKVPHHGSKTTPAWVFEAVQPSLAVISVGEDNIFGHPHGDTLAALAGVPTYRTDLSGRITVRSSGGRLKVSTER
ncbi:MAG: ComEC/Rec2 family competence protein [Dehalococcoidia bacterium]